MDDSTPHNATHNSRPTDDDDEEDIDIQERSGSYTNGNARGSTPPLDVSSAQSAVCSQAAPSYGRPNTLPTGSQYTERSKVAAVLPGQLEYGLITL